MSFDHLNCQPSTIEFPPRVLSSCQQRVLQLVRRFREEWCLLRERERRTVCSADHMFLVLQLAVAEVNKESDGEFTVVLSELILMWKYLLQKKLELLSDPEKVPEGFERVHERYHSFLSRGNTVDLIDVYKVCADLEAEEESEEMLSKVELLDFLMGSSSDAAPQVPTSPPCEQSQSTSKLVPLWRKLLCDYLHLLVNSRSDLALACVFNVPERALGCDAFTHLKHTACRKQMSLYQTAASFIRSLELGGKSYAPSVDDPLMQYVKGLMDLVHFVDKLQEIMGETSDPSIAGGQILSTITRRLLRGQSSESSLYLAGEEVRQELTMRITNAVNRLDDAAGGRTTNISPAQPKVYAINHATAYGGRRTVKAFLAVLDEEAARPPSRGKAELLGGSEENINPLGIPCLLSLFRSPKQSSGSSPKALRHRVRRRHQEENPTKVKLTVSKSQFSCTYKDEVTVLHQQSLGQAPTCVHPAPRPLPSISCGNTLPDGKPKPTTKPTDRANLGKAGTEKAGNQEGSRKEMKRKRLELDSGDENKPPGCTDVKSVNLEGQRCKQPQRGLKDNKTKNKLIPGQLKLTSFFRV
ncbi:PCNA-interacting partner [Hypanus sabinus]|uniref:PCNA-interacting partner n=1 Tax=Hypanus sabinus TaxID=79690 RepID=UPI0028C46299|nr:PCNA-interacting partner [Hypanus sabinus]